MTALMPRTNAFVSSFDIRVHGLPKHIRMRQEDVSMTRRA
jgi:hypothetical protein